MKYITHLAELTRFTKCVTKKPLEIKRNLKKQLQNQYTFMCKNSTRIMYPCITKRENSNKIVHANQSFIPS